LKPFYKTLYKFSTTIEVLASILSVIATALSWFSPVTGLVTSIDSNLGEELTMLDIICKQLVNCAKSERIASE
jgi:hypothetical protein